MGRMVCDPYMHIDIPTKEGVNFKSVRKTQNCFPGFFNNSSFRQFETAAGRVVRHPGRARRPRFRKERYREKGAFEVVLRGEKELLRLVIGCAGQVVVHGELSPVFRGATPKSHWDRESRTSLNKLPAQGKKNDPSRFMRRDAKIVIESPGLRGVVRVTAENERR